MKLLDARESTDAIKDCFRVENAWYEKAVVFSVLICATVALCCLPYGFIAPIFILPYLFVIEKSSLAKWGKETRLHIGDLFLSARRYGRSFCIFVVRLFSSVLIIPNFSLVFSSYIMSDCEELDFKGVLMLSHELSKGKKLQMFLEAIALLACLEVVAVFTFLFLLMLRSFCFIPLKIQLAIMAGAISFTLVCFCIPVWKRLVQNKYLCLKWNKFQ